MGVVGYAVGGPEGGILRVCQSCMGHTYLVGCIVFQAERIWCCYLFT
jgi:hypothetical protein